MEGWSHQERGADGEERECQGERNDREAHGERQVGQRYYLWHAIAHVLCQQVKLCLYPYVCHLVRVVEE